MTQLQMNGYSTLVEQTQKKILSYISNNPDIKLGVSRGVLRESLSELRALGIIETKRKKGTSVVSPNVFGVFKPLIGTGLLDKKALTDLYQLRLMLEIGAADFIFMGKNDKFMAELDEIVGQEAELDQQMNLAKDDASKFKANLDEYLSKLDALDKQYEEMVKSARLDTMVVADRYPFRYLAEDYKLKYSAAFVGCSAETEASFETVVFLATKVDELGLGAILTIENSDGKIAQTIRDNTADKNQEIYALDSMQATTSSDVKNGVTYLSVMTSNLEILKQALN